MDNYDNRKTYISEIDTLMEKVDEETYNIMKCVRRETISINSKNIIENKIYIEEYLAINFIVLRNMRRRILSIKPNRKEKIRGTK